MEICKRRNNHLSNDWLVLSDALIFPETFHLQSRCQCLADYLFALNFLKIDHTTNMEFLTLRHNKQVFFSHLFVLWLLKIEVNQICHVFLFPAEFLKLEQIYFFRILFSFEVWNLILFNKFLNPITSFLTFFDECISFWWMYLFSMNVSLFDECISFWWMYLFSMNVSLFEILFSNAVKRYVSVALNACLPVFKLTLSWRNSLSYRNQSNDLQNKSMDLFLYDRDLRHEKVKQCILVNRW